MVKSMSVNEFMNDVDNRGNVDILDWKKDGKVQVFLHPKSGIMLRKTHWLPTVREEEVEVSKGKNKKKKKVNKIGSVMVVCPNTKEEPDKCPICNLRKMLFDNDNIDYDEPILEITADDETITYLKGDIVGEEGYDWKKNLRYRKEYLFGAINVDDPVEVQPMVVTYSLGKEIKNVIREEIDEEGEEDGDPFKNPYPFKLVYNEDEPNPNDKYKAHKGRAALTEEIEELLEGEGVDLTSLCTPTSISEIVKLLKDILVCDYISIEDIADLDEVNDDEDVEEKVKSKKNKGKDKAKNKKSKKVVEDEDPYEEDEEEEEDESKLKKSKSKKVDKKVKGKGEAKDKSKKKGKKSKKETCPACGEEIDADATECPECGAEFEDDEDTIECPECGEDIPATSDECPECGAEVLPF